MMGVPLDGKAYMFGDIQSVITSGTIPHSSLNKRHNALAYHRVREAIASDVIFFFTSVGRSIQRMSSPSSWGMPLSGHL
jgi:hypothetical protein